MCVDMVKNVRYKKTEFVQERFEIMKKILLALTASASLIGMSSAVVAQTAPATPPPAVLGGTGLGTGATAGLIGAGVVLLIALGGDGVTTTPVTP